MKSDSTNQKTPRNRSNTNALLVKGKYTPLSQSPNPSAYSSSSGISANKMYDSGSGDILSSTNDWDTRVKNLYLDEPVIKIMLNIVLFILFLPLISFIFIF